MSEVWNNVSVYGSASEVERFRQLCIEPLSTEYTNHQCGWDGASCTISLPRGAPGGPLAVGEFQYVDNFQQFVTETDKHYAFSFDTSHWFPDDLFARLAEVFPHLRFDCECIESMDDFMGFGWFNPPPGGEQFDQSYDVPADYWESGPGYKRTPAAEKEHNERIERLLNSLEVAI